MTYFMLGMGILLTVVVVTAIYAFSETFTDILGVTDEYYSEEYMHDDSEQYSTPWRYDHDSDQEL